MLNFADDVCDLARAIKGVYYSPGGFSPCACVCLFVCPGSRKESVEGIFTLMDKNTMGLF